ncbi:hypothetical protein BLNAU_7675 [Blattamonas nauphoetae]|uniref:Uncharacterized protein n=1 Tax=Blattamonas nauphoetae TaxID=2049346 RepID=A0ABQ9Y0N7_9EUKA|nr:hypothetical protein BLNAU_7675 [Blattamonas nauphoetae]
MESTVLSEEDSTPAERIQLYLDLRTKLQAAIRFLNIDHHIQYHFDQLCQCLNLRLVSLATNMDHFPMTLALSLAPSFFYSASEDSGLIAIPPKAEQAIVEAIKNGILDDERNPYIWKAESFAVKVVSLSAQSQSHSQHRRPRKSTSNRNSRVSTPSALNMRTAGTSLSPSYKPNQLLIPSLDDHRICESLSPISLNVSPDPFISPSHCDSTDYLANPSSANPRRPNRRQRIQEMTHNTHDYSLSIESAPVLFPEIVVESNTNSTSSLHPSGSHTSTFVPPLQFNFSESSPTVSSPPLNLHDSSPNFRRRHRNSQTSASVAQSRLAPLPADGLRRSMADSMPARPPSRLAPISPSVSPQPSRHSTQMAVLASSEDQSPAASFDQPHLSIEAEPDGAVDPTDQKPLKKNRSSKRLSLPPVHQTNQPLAVPLPTLHISPRLHSATLHPQYSLSSTVPLPLTQISPHPQSRFSLSATAGQSSTTSPTSFLLPASLSPMNIACDDDVVSGAQGRRLVVSPKRARHG